VAGSDLQLRLVAGVDSELAAAGDSLEATLVRPVRDTNGETTTAGAIFRSHLTQLQKAYIPQRQLLVGIRLDTIVLDGVAVPLTLEPMGEADSHWNAVFRFPIAEKGCPGQGIRLPMGGWAARTSEVNFTSPVLLALVQEDPRAVSVSLALAALRISFGDYYLMATRKIIQVGHAPWPGLFPTWTSQARRGAKDGGICLRDAQNLSKGPFPPQETATDRLAQVRLSTITTKTTRHLSHSPPTKCSGMLVE
jgi:hypothetical protein